MLWYKGWFETRVKLWVSLAFMVAVLIFLRTHTVTLTHAAVAAIVSMPSTFAAVIVVWLAGAGITTQPQFQATKGIHGSTLFTLSLPVSRLRLLAVRAALGWLETVGVLAAFCFGIWFAYPSLKTVATPTEMLGFTGTVVAFASVLYFVSVLLATLLEDTWRIFATMGAFVVLWRISGNAHLPAFADVYAAAGHLSPLIAHTMPWMSMAFSAGLSVVLFFAAVKIAEAREY